MSTLLCFPAHICGLLESSLLSCEIKKGKGLGLKGAGVSGIKNGNLTRHAESEI